MGLDMYFEANKNKWNSFTNFDKEDGKVDQTNYPEDLNVMADYIMEHNFKSVNIKESYQIGYFRKFNALHHYICEHFADGEDDCRPIYLKKKDIQNLLEICQKVKEDHSKANELLPTAEGFFFGNTDYDDWYFSDVDDAVELFELILKEIDFDVWDISYEASW